MARQVLTDASPLIGLCHVDGLPWLHALFGTVAVPEEVFAEVVGRGFAGEQAILRANEAGWLQRAGPSPAEPTLPDLDEGEAACIRLGLAFAGPTLLLMDERAGRAVAQAHGLQVAGTAAVIGMAALRGLVPAATPIFDRLHRSDFRISAEVIRSVLRRVGESA
jgi:predicted nucleic acid-binding protein